jgi:hypothetical protein
VLLHISFAHFMATDSIRVRQLFLRAVFRQWRESFTSELIKAVMTFSWVKGLFILVVVTAASLLQLNSQANDITLPNQSLTFSPLCGIQLAINANESFVCDGLAKIDSLNFLTSLTDNNPMAMGEKLTLSDKKDLLYVPTYNARYISIAQHNREQTKPLYLLAFEFNSPPVPSFTIGYQVNFSPQLDWVLSSASPPSRLSAWKDSNLLYIDHLLSIQV